MQRLKIRIHEILEEDRPNDVLAKVINLFILGLICINIVAIILESVQSLYNEHEKIFYYFELASVIVFSIEYVLRIWSANAHYRKNERVVVRLKYIFKPMIIIDLLAILPFYLSFLVIDLRFMRALRLMRIFRVLKVGRYSKTLKIFGQVLQEKRADLYITLYLIGILLVCASSLLYYTEHSAQPEKFSSIPAAFWWSIATLTTVGYGDIYPVTALGRFFAGIIALLGIGLFALPAGILGSGFVDVAQKRKERYKKAKICPHCGKSVK